jgi:hypothetical protein
MFKRILCFISLLPSLVFAQKLEIGGGLGPTFYKGDLQPTLRVFNPRAGTNLFVRYNFNKVFSYKINGMAGFLAGDDAKSGIPYNVARKNKFRTLLADYNVQAEYNFLNFRTKAALYTKEATPYLFGGFGQTSFLKRKFISPTVINNRTESENNFIVNFGIGYKKRLRPKLNFGVEFGSRVLVSKKNKDALDGFGYYPDGTIFTSYSNPNLQPINSTLIPNTLQADKYFYLSFSMSYLFYKIHCD